MTLLDYICPFPALYKSSKIINKKICSLGQSNEEKPYCYEYASSDDSINTDVLLSILNDTIDNKKILEDKQNLLL